MTIIFGILTGINTLLSIINNFNTVKNIKKMSDMYELNKELTYQQIQLQKREQANKIGIWREMPEDIYVKKRLLGNRDQPRDKYTVDVPIRIENNSNAPIYDIVIITINTQMRDANLDFFRKLKARDDKRSFLYTSSYKMPPGKIYEVVQGNGSGMGNTDEVVYFFRDANNNYWFRGLNGLLEQLEGEKEFNSILHNIGFDFTQLTGLRRFKGFKIKE